ncbi:hypothetical protein LWM68_46460 [Niabella sp. W65]|nr:hypothetical protein [Niabella sp. W65]MCH7369521.1 hypothetical protein [Niabella sp. W65]ULT45056.1 hypothetical protein KRR40_18210 [Niabella sp. I65]
MKSSNKAGQAGQIVVALLLVLLSGSCKNFWTPGLRGPTTWMTIRILPAPARMISFCLAPIMS